MRGAAIVHNAESEIMPKGRTFDEFSTAPAKRYPQARDVYPPGLLRD